MPKRRLLSPQSSYSRQALEEWLVEDLGTKSEHYRRIWKGLPSSGGDIGAVKDLPKSVYEQFDDAFVLSTLKVIDEKTSEHGGGKLVFETQDGHYIETVLIQHTKRSGTKGRTTVCVSSQVGCQMACTFCATGTLGKQANLTAAEILEQVHHARQRDPNCSNVVFMGQGEPLDNYDEVKQAILDMPEAFGIPLQRITLSTVGVVHAIQKLARECPQIQLALSLHAPNDDIRKQIVPTSKAFSLEKILQAVALYQNNNTRSVMMEYIMIDQINSSKDCAHELGKLLEGRNCMVNLIPYNPTEAGDRFSYQTPSNEDMQAFQDIVFQYKGHDGKPLRCTVRWSTTKGQDIDAACGQLALKNILLKSNNNNNRNTKATAADMEDWGQHPKKMSQKQATDKKTTKRKTTTTTTSSNQKPTNDVVPNASFPWFFKSSSTTMVVAAAGGALLVGGAASLWVVSFWRQKR